MTSARADGWEAFTVNEPDGFVRNVIEVVVGHRTADGFTASGVVPTGFADEEHPVNRPRTAYWGAVQYPLGGEQGEVPIGLSDLSVKVPLRGARALALAILAHLDGDSGGEPGDASALRRDLTHERERGLHDLTVERMRVDKMLDVVLTLAQRPSLVMAEPYTSTEERT